MAAGPGLHKSCLPPRLDSQPPCLRGARPRVVPVPPAAAPSETHLVLARLYPSMHGWLRAGERLLLHQEELGDCVMGVAAGYLLWSEILPDGPWAITAMEQLLKRQMGTVGRMIVAAVDDVPSSRLAARDASVPRGHGPSSPIPPSMSQMTSCRRPRGLKGSSPRM